MPTTAGFTSAPLTLTLLTLFTFLAFAALLLPSTSNLHAYLTHLHHGLSGAHQIFTLALLYSFRPVERLWGTRKYASFLLTILPYVLFVHVLGVWAQNAWIHHRGVDRSIGYPTYAKAVRDGVDLERLGLTTIPTILIFAIQVQYSALIPYKWDGRSKEEIYRDDVNGELRAQMRMRSNWDTARYVLAAQLAVAEQPGCYVVAVGGWVVGHMWRMGLLPGRGVVDRVMGVPGLPAAR